MSKSVHGFGQAAFPRKYKKSHKEHISPKFATPWGRHRFFERDQIWQVGLALGQDLITPANFNLGRLRTGCVALLESLLFFGFQHYIGCRP